MLIRPANEFDPNTDDIGPLKISICFRSKRCPTIPKPLRSISSIMKPTEKFGAPSPK